MPVLTTFCLSPFVLIQQVCSIIKMPVLAPYDKIAMIYFYTGLSFIIKIHMEVLYITKTRLFKYIEKSTTKNCKFSDKNSDIFHICAQNIDCGYLLELPRRGGSNEYPQSMFLSRNIFLSRNQKKIMYTL